ncbi:MAG: hypothetical protein HKN23_04265, partial [Verrucomicrobiales bacterium]|nr:hypothetical protein [Verrucomicrobiales bacterium]
PEPEPEPEAEAEDLPRPRVLVVHGASATGRLVRETLEDFSIADVDTCPDAVYGFELALQRDYQLFLFALHLPLIDGPLLYELICKAQKLAGNGIQAPGVIFVREPSDPPPAEDLNRDARVKGFLMKPLKIERLLQVVKHALPRRKKKRNTLFE